MDCAYHISSTLFFVFSLNEIIEVNILIFAENQSEARKMRWFTEGCEQALKTTERTQGEIIINCRTRLINISGIW